MMKGFEYETVLAKMMIAFGAAVAVVMGVIILMGIQLTSCNPFVLVFGVATVTALFTVCSII